LDHNLIRVGGRQLRVGWSVLGGVLGAGRGLFGLRNGRRRGRNNDRRGLRGNGGILGAVTAHRVAQAEAQAAKQDKAAKEHQQLEGAKRQLGVPLAPQLLKLLRVKYSVH
jgi:hypothetical protein